VFGHIRGLTVLNRPISAFCLALCIGYTAPALQASDMAADAVEIRGGHLPPLPAGATILAFGDSLTAGIGGSGFDYPQRLAQLTGHDVVNAGVPGDTSAQGRARLGGVLLEVRPRLLILCLGVNDFLHKVPHEVLRANLQAMLDESSAAGVPVLLLAVPAPETRLVDSWFMTLAQPDRVRVEAHAMADVLRQPALKADLVHPNEEGYRQIADAVARSLRDSGALSPVHP
jgi:acyl-CoA thioesterase-1